MRIGEEYSFLYTPQDSEDATKGNYLNKFLVKIWLYSWNIDKQL